MFEMKQEKYGDVFSAVALHNDAVEEGSAACVCVRCCCWHREILNYSRRRILLDAIVRETGLIFTLHRLHEAESTEIVLKTQTADGGLDEERREMSVLDQNRAETR